MQVPSLRPGRGVGARRLALGGPEGPLVSLIRSPEAGEAAVVVERRAADVAVVGGSTTAVLAAYSLAKSGRKVVLLPDFGLRATQPAARPVQPLKLTDPDPLLVHLAAEAGQYWRGLELLAGSPGRLLSQQATLDVCCDCDRDHPGAAGFSRLQDACAAAGVPVSLLSAEEANTGFRPLQLPNSGAALLQEQGGLLLADTAAGAAQQLARGEGVQMREGLLLRGWRDRGSCFELRASSRVSPELVSLFEAEVLLLVPSHWHASCLGLFSLQVEGLQDVELLSCGLAAGDEAARLPAVFSWGGAAAADNPLQPEGTVIMPHQRGRSPPSLLLQQASAWGVPISDPFAWQPASSSWSSQRLQAEKGSGASKDEAAVQAGSSSSSSWVDPQITALHQSASQLVRGVAPPSAVSSVHSSLRSIVPDGRPLLGLHPGFDQGRVVLCCSASGSQRFGPGSSCSSSFHLSPILAKLAADIIRTGGASAAAAGSGAGAVLQGLGLSGRQGLKVEVAAGQGQQDTWERLQQLQQPQVVSKDDRERQQDEEADRRQDVWNEEPQLL